MTQTYTEPIQTVSDGDTITYDTADAADNLEILNAECRWRGITREETQTVTDYASRDNYDQATATTSTDTARNRNTDTGSGNGGAKVTIPPVPSGYSFDRVELDGSVSYFNDNGTDADVVYEDADGTQKSKTVSPGGSTQIVDDTTTSTNVLGETREIFFSFVPSGTTTDAIAMEVSTYGKKTTTESQTASTSYPSPPSGYSFDRHREEKSDGTDTFHYDNRVGQTESITSNSTSNTVWVRLTTRGKDTSTVTDTFKTENPSVSGDASASYSGTLNDGEWSPWIQLSGFTEGQNSLTQDIDGSFDADFELRYEWQFTVPDTLAEHRFVINGTTYVTALADPTDEAVQYDFYRTYIADEGIVCYDVVDVDDADASPYRIYHPTYGVKALRDKS